MWPRNRRLVLLRNGRLVLPSNLPLTTRTQFQKMVLARKMKKGAYALCMHIYPPLNSLKAGCFTD
jgi:hypothetical protein